MFRWNEFKCLVRFELVLNKINIFNIPDVDECLSNPCDNGASCENLVNAYRCHCAPGFSGTHCEMSKKILNLIKICI